MDWETLLKDIMERPHAELVLAPSVAAPPQVPTTSPNVPQPDGGPTADLPADAQPENLAVSDVPESSFGSLEVATGPEAGIGPVAEPEAPPSGTEATLETSAEPQIAAETLEIATGTLPATEALETVAPTPPRQDAVEVPSAPEAALQPELDTPDQPQLRGDVLEIATLPDFAVGALDIPSVPQGTGDEDLPVGRPARSSTAFTGLRTPGQPASIPGSMQFPDGFVPLDEDHFVYDPNSPGGGDASMEDDLTRQIGADFEQQIGGMRDRLQDELSRVISEQAIMLTMAESDD